jgi:hypothetical protein
MDSSLLHENLASPAPVSEAAPWTINEADPAQPPRGRSRLWLHVALACLLLGLSAGARAWQDHRFAESERSSLAVPFKLAALPTTIGPWEAIRKDLKLDPETVQIAGAHDYIQRTYLDRRTGVELAVLVVAGPSTRVGGHTPEVCYPACGYSPADEPIVVSLAQEEAPGRFRGAFRGGIYARELGGDVKREEAFCSFRFVRAEGQWDPDPLSPQNWRRYRHSPGLVKIQVQRILSQGELLTEDGPCQEFLKAIVPQIEELMAKERRR